MSRKRDLQDLSIRLAISGCEDVGECPVRIEDDYLLREKMENRMEQGFSVPEDFIPEMRTEYEKEVYKAAKALEELEGSRVNRVMPEYPEDENDRGIIQPKSVTVVII